jgi:PAS domain S-box-containing protein
VPDVTADPDWLPNPLLPGTKAEVAVPIILEDEVLGVLDIQHNVAGGLGQADVTLLTSIASQVAIGLQNARQYQQVQESEARTQAVLDAINVPLLITRVSDGSFMYFNDPALEAVGISRHNLTGRKASIFYNDESSGRQQFMATLREKGRVDNLELTLKRVTGEPFQVVMSARVINFQGEPAVMTSFIDVTEQHKTQGALLRRAAEMETVADLGTVSATILDPDRLLKEVVNLIKARFDLYHAHIHLLNDTKETMVLTAGAGEIGQKMVAEGRQIPLAAKGSLVATVARTRQGAIRNYDPPGEGFMPHPLLSKTSCEMAVPISVGDEVLGVLDVRSEELNYFTEADMQTYTIMASQIAVALQNARSYSKSEEAVRELQELSRRLTREGWNEFFQQQLDELVFRYDLEQVSQVLDSAEEPVADMQALLTQPLQVQGESIGELLLGSARLNAVEAAEILAAVADRLSAHLENLRLAQQTQIALNETQQRTEELAVLNEMSQSLTAQTTVDGVFQTVYDYLSRLMDTTNFYTVLYEEDSNEVVFVLTASGEELRWYTERRQAGHGITEYLIRQRQPLLMPDNVGQRLAALGVEGYGKLPESWMGVPIILGERVLGVIGLESYATPYLYSEQHLNLLTAVANQAAIAIESKRLLEGTVALAEEEQILRQITTRVSAAIDAESILRTAAEEIGRALGLEGDIVLEGVGSNGTARAVNGSKN